jgi:histidinol-phosphate aminotransferase
VAVDLSDNTNLWGPHPAATEALRASLPENLARYPSVYATPLKEAVGRRFGIHPENVTTGCGSDDLLDSVFRAATFPPGRVTHPEPTFSMVEIFSRMNGLETHPVPWQEAETDPERLLEKQPDLVYVCRPNNPSGHSPSRGWVEGLLESSGPEGPLIVLDEAYADFARDDFLKEAVRSERLLVLRTFSKLYGIAGLRVGFGVGPVSLIREVEKARGPFKVSQIAQAAAIASIEDPSGWAAGVVAETISNRDRLRRELQARGLPALPSEANFLLIPLEQMAQEPSGPLVTPPSSRPPGQNHEGAARDWNEALRARGVACRPFEALPGVGEALRVTIGPWWMMERFLEALDDALGRGGGS